MKKKATWLVVLRRILLWLNMLVAAGYLLSAYVGYISPERAGYLSLAGLAYPLLLIALLLFFPLWLLLHRRYLLIGVAALAASLPQLWAFCPLNFGGGERQDFRLMTYNVYGMSRGDSTMVSTLDEILNHDADFVCLQETSKEKSLKYAYRDGAWDRAKQQYPYMELSAGESMLGYFSKTPVTTVCEGKERPYFDYAVYRTELDGRTAFFMNLHLESIGLTHSDKELYLRLTSPDESEKTLRGVRSRLMSKLRRAYRERARQARLAREKIDSIRSEYPQADFFVCGDFNDTPYSYSYLTLRGDFDDAYSDGAAGITHTYNKDRFYFHIDHILYAGGWEAVSTRRGTTRASDHYALIADFRKNKNN